MKRINLLRSILSFSFLILALTAFAVEDGCNATSPYLAGDQADAYSIYTDFQNNCCVGSTISIIILNESGTGGSMLTVTLPEDGINSSCNVFIAE
jgi:hypothetical protein